MGAALQSNFAFLEEHDQQLVRLGLLAEKYFSDDPNTCLIKLRQLAELLAQLVATKVGIFRSPQEGQYDLLYRLRDQGILPPEIAQLFGEVRRTGNAATHSGSGDHRTALATLKISWQLGLWFHRTFSKPSFKSGPFVPPVAPKHETEALQLELDRLREELRKYQTTDHPTTFLYESSEYNVQSAEREHRFWEQLVIDADTAKPGVERRLTELQSAAAQEPKSSVGRYVEAAKSAAAVVRLDEAETRKIIDEQLVRAGWQADSVMLSYSKGARPEKAKFMAIAEWPTNNGPADYVLFSGLIPLATVEAKRKNIDVSGSLQQAKRYSRGFELNHGLQAPGEPWGEYKIPFAFSSNGRPYLRQLATLSGIWFCDLRHPDNHGHALDGWYTPEGLTELLKRNDKHAHEQLVTEPFNYGFILRPYQQEAIHAIEQAIAVGKREMLLAMATGTGKTKTCIALIYRLLKAQRFRRVLFLVDRSALGEQATNAFKDTQMESLQTFGDIFGIKELEEQEPDSETAVHVATVQGMVRRILVGAEGKDPPTVDQYDCIVVDECHRGYLLDRELSETELTFRSYDDYISKYRRVLDYFDAVKIGLTATPALHTTQIFGMPIYSYSYREAVVDGYLIDHEPPIQIKTELSNKGIRWVVGEEVKVYNVKQNEVRLFTTPDEIKIDVEEFNRKVITEPFNKVICQFLARELDPNSRAKTLVFCANDAHADLVVDLLKGAFKDCYGNVEDDAVIKITGAADKPLQLIRRYKNERNPNVAVTVDLLTTGIDVPQICNLVFIRRVNSRILFDQMLGRATRLCDEIGKESFRIFDAVRIYEALEKLTAMQPVVADPKISFSQLVREVTALTDIEARMLAKEQLIAKLHRKKRHFSEKNEQDFEACAGISADAFIRRLNGMSLDEVASWLTQNPDLGEILDRKGGEKVEPIFISEHEDKFVEASRGYGKAKKPADYLKEFSEFIKSQGNIIPALVTVLTRPRELTRKQLRELALELDKAGFSETNLEIAWREMTNHDIAARIIGYIRQAALGDALIPYDQRVDQALQKILTSKYWTNPQRQWLQKIAAQTKANVIVDREAFDDPDLVFKREGGGFGRINRIFEGELQMVLDKFKDEIWKPAA
jgi:type I restriction enzyme, R subunit